MRGNMNKNGLKLISALSLVAATVAMPAAAQAPPIVDLSRFYQLGDSYTAGYLDACWVEYGQRESFGAIIARQAGVSFEQPLLGKPGLGSGIDAPNATPAQYTGCRYLTGFSSTGTPVFAQRKSVLSPLNLTLPRPYNNLAIPGYKVGDVTDTKAGDGNSLADLTLRTLGGTTLLQAASQAPSFVTIFIGGNDVLGAVLNGTAIDGVTVTSVANFRAKYQKIVTDMKAAQGGTAKGIVIGLADVTYLPYANAVSPVIPGTNINYLGQKGGNLLGGTAAIAPIPAGSLVTLAGSVFASTGYGIPCAVFTAGGVPVGHPARANCDKPLPDSATAALGLPGAVLYPDEVALIKTRTEEFTADIKSIGEGSGYKFYDVRPFFQTMLAGKNIAGITIGTPFLTGGFFSYDGFHPTSLGWALVADDIIKFMNASYGAKIPEPDLYPYLFNGNTSSGGFPTGLGLALTQDQVIAAGAQIFGGEAWREALKVLAPLPANFDLEAATPVSYTDDLGKSDQ